MARRLVDRGVLRRTLIGAVAVVTAAGGLAACGSSSGSGANTITLYNGQHQQTTEALVRLFEAQTGIKVQERDGDENALAAQIEQEGSSSPADVIYTENSPALQALDGKGLLAPVESTTLGAVPATYSSPNHDWVGVSARVSVIVYNTSLVSAAQLPTSVLDLASPRWKGKLALSPTETDFQPIVTSIAAAKGRAAALAWLKAVKANAGNHIYPDNETVTSDVNNGQVAIGIINHYYWFRLRAEVGKSQMHSAISYLAPGDPGYVLDVSGAGVLKSSTHQADAQKLLAFLVSFQGESSLAHSNSFEYPLGSGVAADPALEPFAQLQPAPLAIAQLGDGSLALQLLQAAQLA